MIATPMQTSYRFKTNIRPIKYAYFVRDDGWDGLTRVIRFVCTQWGGIRSLIIPVRSDLTMAPIMEHLLQLHEPDLFVNYMGDTEQAEPDGHNTLQERLAKLWPYRSVQLQIGSHIFEKFDSTLHPLGAIPDDGRGSELICHEFGGPQEDEPILLALFGAIYSGQQQDYDKAVILCPSSVEIGGPNFWSSQFDDRPFGSVLNLTAFGVRPRTAKGPTIGSNHFDISVVDSPSSLCMYWNYRATRDATQFQEDMGRRTLLLPLRLFDDQTALSTMVEFIRSRLPYAHVSTNRHMLFSIWSHPDPEKLQAILSSMLGLQKFAEKTVSVYHSWGKDEPTGLQDFTNKPITFHFSLPVLTRSYLEGISNEVGRDVRLQEGTNEVIVEPPTGYSNRFGGNVVLDLECDVWKRFGKTIGLAEKIRHGSWFSRYGLTSIAAVIARPQYININIPGEKEALEIFFAERGYQIRVSKPGQYASAVVNLVGGLSGVDVIASRPAYRLLDTLALKSTHKLAQRIVQQLVKTGIAIPPDLVTDIQPLLEDLEIIPELKRVPKSYQQLCNLAEFQIYRKDLLACLARLSEKQIIKRGFHLPCPTCGTPSWYPLATIEENVVCPGCSWRFPLPVEHPTGSEVQWEHTLNSLVNRAMDQDALVSAIVLRHLTKERQASCLIPGVELLQLDQIKAELDFAFVSDQEVFAGECKVGDTLSIKDINTARLATELGVKNFYFCTLTMFDEESKKAVQDLRGELASKDVAPTVEILEGSVLLRGPETQKQ
jgi:hypothetical protein